MKRLQAAALILLFALGAPVAAVTEDAAPATAPAKANDEIAVFAAGCFWCVESDFDKVEGVLETTSGYIGGELRNPTYDDVATGITGHVEAVRVRFDPSVVSYQQLLDHYWLHVDPTDGRGQFCDRGSAYRPAIFVYGAEQTRLAQASKKTLAESGKLSRPIAVQIMPATLFWPAETEHQDYYKKNPIRYRLYRTGCGRDARLSQVWGSAYAH